MRNITEIRDELSMYSSKMSAEEIIAWNEMLQNPSPKEADLNSFLENVMSKYSICGN